MRTFPSILAILAPLLLASSCGRKDEPSYENFASLRDLREAPSTLQEAGRAIVRLTMSDGYGTGSLVKLPQRTEPVLMTNHHVIGLHNCFAAGCEVRAAYDHAFGSESRIFTLTIVPLAASLEADVSFFSIVKSVDDDGKDAAMTPRPLEFEAKDAASLVGSPVHIVGHPKGRLKKWSAGNTIGIDGDYVAMTNDILPGNSGSPLLNAQGKIVGIVHHAATDSQIALRRGIASQSFGSPSSWLLEIAASAAGFQLASFGFTEPQAEFDADDLLSHLELFKNSKAAPRLKGEAAEKGMLGILAPRCDAAISRLKQSPSLENVNALSPCDAAVQFIDCSKSAKAYHSCPKAAEKQAWQDRFRAASAASAPVRSGFSNNADRFLTSPFYALEESEEAGYAIALKNLREFHDARKSPLTLPLAGTLLSWQLERVGAAPHYSGANLRDFVLNYRNVPGHEYALARIGSAFFDLRYLRLVSWDVLASEFRALLLHPRLSVADRLELEELAYRRGLL